MNNSPIVGIDLGTTFSLIGCMQDGVPVLFSNAAGDKLTASAVYLDESNCIHVGQAARSRAILAPERSVIHFKRDMGTDKYCTLGGRAFRPEELSALVLRSLKESAEAQLGCPVSRAVISVPAYFGENQRQATRAAAEIAGLEVVRLINEPTAAALAYGVNQTDTDQKIAILDLGGGTFDVTLLELVEGVIEICSSAGDLFLGGLDFDRALAQLIRQQAEQQQIFLATDAATEARLLDSAERAKKALSFKDSVAVAISDIKTVQGGRVDLNLPITRTQAELVWASLTERLLGPLRQALRDAEWLPRDIDEVILVGGSTRMPLVGRLFTDFFSRIPQRSLPPDEAIAIGAVLTAGLMANDAALEELVVTDIAPFTPGVDLAHSEGSLVVENIFHPLIERGTVIPCSRTMIVQPINLQSTSIELKVFQGEHALCDRNTLLGTLAVKGIPRDNRSVEVRYTYDLNGILEVEATVLGTRRKVSTLINQGARHLSTKELEQARQNLQKYKLHPRDELANQAVLAQAELLYQNTLGEQRQHIGELIHLFRLVLESQDPTAIQEMRQQLRGYLHDED